MPEGLNVASVARQWNPRFGERSYLVFSFSAANNLYYEPNMLPFCLHRMLLKRCTLTAILSMSVLGCQPKFEPAERHDMSVRTQIVKFETRPRTKSLIGQYQASVQSDMSFRISGRIETRIAEVGDHVNVGDILAELDPIQQTAGVDAANAALRSAKATADERQTNMRRVEQLLPQKAVSRQEFDDSKASMLSAEGNVKIAEGKLETAMNQLSYTQLTATVPGVITDRKAEVGQVVAAGVAVYTIAADGGREAVFDTFPTDFLDRPISNDIDLSLQSDPRVKTKGVIRDMSPEIDSVDGTIRVNVSIPNPPEQFLLGAPLVGSAHFKPSHVVSLPWTSLSRQGDDPAVWIVDPKSHVAKERTIVVDGYESGTILVKSGLEAGEMVVTQGTQLIRPGQKVTPIADANQEQETP